ncbi:MAG: toll/interleukin-1 receptor domain-containing protein [Candidatus Tectomicrobia bacterium]|uniref:Toll/interleukin-1 receptor domain-containing protein n=1 Tax=Tectimicrobiota bacterium TaxID=2528274 RepID=A0A937W498_UNCTE|nr:toll/interleukin-1 receptor domain-containing protein [Candidatus Tectomicrobia bacterium]
MVGRVFISHASADNAFAQQICHYLEAQGISCWMAPRDVPAGSNWAEALMDAIDAAQAMIVLLSEHSNQSGPVMSEIVRADQQHTPLFPIKLHAITLQRRLEFFLSPWHWLDLSLLSLEEALPKLAEALRTAAPPPHAVNSVRHNSCLGAREPHIR